MASLVDIDRPKKASFVKVRFLIFVMATLGPVVCYMSRQNLSLAIVAMVKDSESENENESTEPINLNSKGNLGGSQSLSNLSATIGKLVANETPIVSDTCPAPVIISASGQRETARVISYGPKYDWTQSQKSLVFETFFFTYVGFQVPGARVAERFGAKWVLATATIGSSLLSLLTPWAVSVSVYAFALIRALMGVCQTALYPASYVLYSHWLPPLERSQALPILGAGAYIGSILTSIATGYFSEQKTLGWEYAFYLPSVICGLWSIVWILIGASEPREHKFISLEEIEYIESKMEIRKSANSKQTKKSPSWKKLFTSQHIWAMMAAFLASNWAFTITLLLIPSYLSYIHHVPQSSNGYINAVIYTLFCVSSPIVGAVAALMIETRACSLTRLQIRKFFQCFAVLGQAVCFVAVPLIGCDTKLILALLFAQIVVYSFVNGGEVQLPSDLSVDFAGTIYAIGNCVGSSTGFLVPRVHSFIVRDSHAKSQWDLYFYVAALVTSIGGLIFLIFGKNDLQDFSKEANKSQADIYKLSIEPKFSVEVVSAEEAASRKANKEKQISI